MSDSKSAICLSASHSLPLSLTCLSLSFTLALSFSLSVPSICLTLSFALFHSLCLSPHLSHSLWPDEEMRSEWRREILLDLLTLIFVSWCCLWRGSGTPPGPGADPMASGARHPHGNRPELRGANERSVTGQDRGVSLITQTDRRNLMDR